MHVDLGCLLAGCSNASYDDLVWGCYINRFCVCVLLLLGDRVVFAESPTAPGVPIVYRLPEERQSNPDRLNLDRLVIIIAKKTI